MEYGHYFSYVVMSCFLVSLSHGEAQFPIINKKEISNNDQFIMTCKIESFRGISLPKSDVVTKLMMYRQLKDSQKEEFLGSVVSNAIGKKDPVDKRIPGGRRWDYLTGGFEHKPNRDTIFMILNVKDATCLDAGDYWCAVQFEGSDERINSPRVTLQMKDAKKIKMSAIKVTPTKRSTFNTSVNNLGDTVTMECSFTSWDPMTPLWSLNNLFFEHSSNVMVYNTTSWLTTAGCRVYFQRSTKTVLLDYSMEDVTFFCQAASPYGEDADTYASMKFIILYDSGQSKSRATTIHFGKNSVLIFLSVVLLVFRLSTAI